MNILVCEKKKKKKIDICYMYAAHLFQKKKNITNGKSSNRKSLSSVNI